MPIRDASQKALVAYLKRKDPSLQGDDITQVVSSLRRFVILAQKLYTEPQARLMYLERKVDDKKTRTLVIKTDIDELVKVKDGSHSPIKGVLRKFMGEVTKGKTKNGI